MHLTLIFCASVKRWDWVLEPPEAFLLPISEIPAQLLSNPHETINSWRQGQELSILSLYPQWLVPCTAHNWLSNICGMNGNTLGFFFLIKWKLQDSPHPRPTNEVKSKRILSRSCTVSEIWQCLWAQVGPGALCSSYPELDMLFLSISQ